MWDQILQLCAVAYFGTQMLLASLACVWLVGLIRCVLAWFGSRSFTALAALRMLKQVKLQDVAFSACPNCGLARLVSERLYIEVILDQYDGELGESKIIIWRLLDNGLKDFDNALVICYYGNEPASGCEIERQIESIVSSFVRQKVRPPFPPEFSIN